MRTFHILHCDKTWVKMTAVLVSASGKVSASWKVRGSGHMEHLIHFQQQQAGDNAGTEGGVCVPSRAAPALARRGPRQVP